MSSERLYTEAEAVEIIQRALNGPEVDAQPSGLTKYDLWRIAEEAGATRSQFDLALAASDLKPSKPTPSGIFGSPTYSSVIAGELTPDDFVVVDERLPDSLGAKLVQHEGRTMKVRIDKGMTNMAATVSSRKGQTSIRVGTSSANILLPGVFAAILISCYGVLLMVAGHSLAAWLVMVLAPLVGAFVAMISARFARKKSLDFYNLLTLLVNQSLAADSVIQAEANEEQTYLETPISEA